MRVFARTLTVLALALIAAFSSCNRNRDKLLADLQSARPEIRAAAVRKLAAEYQADDLGLFTQAARDPAPIVRGEAMSALGKSSDPRVVDLLGDALGDSDEMVQANAARALAVIRSDKAKAYLRVQYGRRSRDTRAVIVQALKNTNMPGAMASVVAAEANEIWQRNLKAINTGSLPERAGAAEELGRSGRPEAVNRLVPLLKDNQIVLAAAAARGLGYAGDARAVPALIPLLNENLQDLRAAAVEALMRLRDRAALPQLTSVALEHSPTSPVAATAIIALDRAPETDRALCEIALSGPTPEAQIAAREQGKRGGCPVEQVNDKLRTAPAAALFALANLKLGSRDLLSKILPSLASSDPTIRRLAADAVAEIGDPSAATAVLKAFDSEMKLLEPLRSDWIPAELPKTFAPGFDPNVAPDPNDPSAQVRARTADLFRKVAALRERRLLEAGRVQREPLTPRELVDDVSDDQLRVLVSLCRAVGKLKVDGALDRLRPLTKESNLELRGAAFAAAAHAGDDGIALAVAGLRDAEDSVQKAAALGLVEVGEAGKTALLGSFAQLPGDRGIVLDALVGSSVPSSHVAEVVALLSLGGLEAQVATQLLGDCVGSEEVISGLLHALNDANFAARREAIVSLGRLKDPRAADALVRELYSESSDLRGAAAEALAHIPGTTAGLEALDALKGDYYVSVRKNAADALNALNAAAAAGEKH